MSSDRPENAEPRDQAATTTETVREESPSAPDAEVRPAEPVTNGSVAARPAEPDAPAENEGGPQASEPETNDGGAADSTTPPQAPAQPTDVPRQPPEAVPTERPPESPAAESQPAAVASETAGVGAESVIPPIVTYAANVGLEAGPPPNVAEAAPPADAADIANNVADAASVGNVADAASVGSNVADAASIGSNVADAASIGSNVADAASVGAYETNPPAAPGIETNVAGAGPDAGGPPHTAATAEPAPTDAQNARNAASGPDESQSTGESRPRVRLNPTVNEELAKPIPTYSPSPSQPPAGESPASPAAPSGPPAEAAAGKSLEAAAEAAMQSQGTAEAPAERRPVDLPPKVDQLDADLEAEIAAALSGGAQAETAAEPPAAGEAEPAISEESLQPGTKLVGTVESIHGDNVFLNLKLRSPGVVQLRQFESARRPNVGQMLEVVVDRVDAEEGLIQCSLPKGIRRPAGDWDAVSVGQVVDCTVTKTNKGGLEVNISNLRGFLPVSQVDLRYVENLEPFVGQKLRVKIIEVKPQKRNLVVSRRAYLEMEREEAEKELWAKLETGQEYAGTVKTIKPYGAFVDIGGVDGFLHIGDMSWSRINHPSEILQEGAQVDVKVVSLDPEKKKIGLSLRAMTANPWSDVETKYPIGSTVRGTVTRTTNFGAFVQLEAGVEGLIHISELEHRRVSRVTEVLKVGQEVDAQVLQVDPERQRIGLSLKALQAKPEKPAAPSDADLAPSANEPEAARKRQGPLKGGIGGNSGKGGLFGNPNDFT